MEQMELMIILNTLKDDYLDAIRKNHDAANRYFDRLQNFGEDAIAAALAREYDEAGKAMEIARNLFLTKILTSWDCLQIKGPEKESA